ncbi:MAG: ribose 5-phosphate isomerase B [Pyrinomonadaceae bacterium]|nr:ribose 5-phosphate isomerase B [Blastocatellia bacterium]MCW5957903.1 ribose 5-phosphate isomerase B [Pyrinomonadaceae bacterium]
MSIVDQNTREKVRELVREVLSSVPDDAAEARHEPEHVIVNSLRERTEREWDRDESAKLLITEDDLRGLDSGSRVRVSADAKFTPLASDIVSDKHLVLIRKESRNIGLKIHSVAIGADHGGFQMKEQLKSFLSELGVKVRDFGTNSADPVDYPDFAHAVAKAVGSGQVDGGILVDGAGIGSAMAANKVPGVRAAACYSAALAKNSREHNGANVLTLGSGQNGIDEVKAIVEAFITTEISEARHKHRVGKIDSIDREYRK